MICNVKRKFRKFFVKLTAIARHWCYLLSENIFRKVYNNLKPLLNGFKPYDLVLTFQSVSFESELIIHVLLDKFSLADKWKTQLFKNQMPPISTAPAQLILYYNFIDLLSQIGKFRHKLTKPNWYLKA